MREKGIHQTRDEGQSSIGTGSFVRCNDDAVNDGRNPLRSAWTQCELGRCQQMAEELHGRQCVAVSKCPIGSLMANGCSSVAKEN